ncbi:MAG: helix-turn-helix domain-containing protein, partial [Promethearchaeota archaeon]
MEDSRKNSEEVLDMEEQEEVQNPYEADLAPETSDNHENTKIKIKESNTESEATKNPNTHGSLIESKIQKLDKSERRGRRLSDEKIEKIRELRKKGLSLRVIKKLMPNVSKSTISKYIRDVQLTEKQREQLERNNQENRLKNYNKFFKTRNKHKLEASGFKEQGETKEFHHKTENSETIQIMQTKKEKKPQENSSEIKSEKREKGGRRG